MLSLNFFIYVLCHFCVLCVRFFVRVDDDTKVFACHSVIVIDDMVELLSCSENFTVAPY